MVKSLLANPGDTGSIPGLGGSHMLCRSWARVPQLLSRCALELELWSKMPPQWEAHAPQAEKARCGNKDPVQPKVKINKILKINKGFLKISFQLCMAHHNRNLDPAYWTYMQSTSYEMPAWIKHKLESRLPGEISITSDMPMTPPLWQKVKRH